jgi:hypothetical protein
MLRWRMALAGCVLLAATVSLVTASATDGDAMSPGYVDEVSAPLGSPAYEKAIQTDPLKGYYHGQDTSNHLANSGALSGACAACGSQWFVQENIRWILIQGAAAFAGRLWLSCEFLKPAELMCNI